MTGWANNKRALIALANGLFLCAAYTHTRPPWLQTIGAEEPLAKYFPEQKR